jgi:outer membrane protein
MRYPKFVLFFLIFLFAYGVNAQKIWSLQDCVDYALANNIQIKQQELSVQIAKINLLQSKVGLLPDLNGNISHSYNFGQTVDMYTNQFATDKVQSDNFYLSSSVTLFNGFQLLNTVKQNKVELEAGKFDADKMRNDISLNIATAYLQILYNIELLDNAQSQTAVTNLQVQRTEKLVDAGSAAKGVLLTLQAQQATEELSVVNAQNQLDLSYLTLVQLLDIQSADSFEIEKPLLDVSALSATILNPESVYGIAVGIQPEIKSSEPKLKSSEIGLSIAHGMRSPSLSLRGSYGTGYSGASTRLKDITYGYSPSGYTSSGDTVFSIVPTATYENTPFKDQINKNKNKSISFNLTVPIFNGWRTNTAISKAKIAMLNAEYTLAVSKNTLYKTIQQAYADATASMNKYTASQKSVDAYKEAFKYAEQKFDVGLSNTLDYNDAKNKYAKAQSELLQAKYEYVFRMKVLDFYLGKPITLK